VPIAQAAQLWSITEEQLLKEPGLKFEDESKQKVYMVVSDPDHVNYDALPLNDEMDPQTGKLIRGKLSITADVTNSAQEILEALGLKVQVRAAEGNQQSFTKSA
jgi:hypothetical protein